MKNVKIYLTLQQIFPLFFTSDLWEGDGFELGKMLYSIFFFSNRALKVLLENFKVLLKFRNKYWNFVHLGISQVKLTFTFKNNHAQHGLI